MHDINKCHQHILLAQWIITHQYYYWANIQSPFVKLRWCKSDFIERCWILRIKNIGKFPKYNAINLVLLLVSTNCLSMTVLRALSTSIDCNCHNSIFCHTTLHRSVVSIAHRQFFCWLLSIFTRFSLLNWDCCRLCFTRWSRQPRTTKTTGAFVPHSTFPVYLYWLNDLLT